MKKIFALLTILLNLTIMAQSKFETYDFGTFKLHVYYSGDVMNDASYIIEGADSLVTMEEPLFKVNVKEFNEYLDKLGKPVEKTITDYHIGGTADRDLTMAYGMEAFSKGPVYGGMMKSFQKAFGDSMVDLPTGKVSEVDFVRRRLMSAICRCLLALPFILSKWDESRHFWGKIPFVICSSCFPAMLKAGRG